MHLRFAIKWAWIGVVFGIIAFTYNYTMVPLSLPGYEFIAAPAMFALSFFSEETPFWPKMAIFLAGQYFAYFLVIYIGRFIYHGNKRHG